jgi:hypothetical protein
MTDVAAVKQALVDIVLRRKAEAEGEAEQQQEPGGATAAPGVNPVWTAVLTAYGREWNGKKESWVRFRGFLELFAKDRGVLLEATNFLNAAEQFPDDASRIRFFAKHGVVIEGGKADGSEPEAPEEDSEGRRVDMVLSTAKESDGGGDFLWVRVGGRTGKIHLKSRKFTEEDNPRFADLPTTDSRGRRISLVKAGGAKGEYTVRVEELWGKLVAATRVFTAERPGDSAYADWSGRDLNRDGYAEGGTSESGRWYQPWDDKKIFLFMHNDDTREWAKAEQITSTTVGGVQQRVEDVVKAWATRYPDQL